MSRSALLPKGKKKLLNSLCSYLVNLFIPAKPLVVLEACTAFHLEHFSNIIHQLSLTDKYYICVITPDGKGMNKLKNVSIYNTIDDFPLYKKADAFISTEFNKIPFWFSCPTIYFGHGIGPKLDYVNNKELFEYDFVFSPCRPIFNIQKELLPAESVFPIGLPILDQQHLTHQTNEKNAILAYFNLDAEKPILVYAPSWSSNVDKISDIKKILKFLASKTQLNIIISPHPLLFKPERCSGKVFFPTDNTADGIHINKPGSKFSTLELVQASSVIISDISSILFEAMALKKNVLFDGNKALYEHSNALHIYEEVIQVCHTPCWDNLEDLTIENSIKFDTLFSQREHFINNYLFNNGTAGDVFIQKLNELIKHD